jgi:DNA-binding transcriptional LysR family regulator
MQLYDIVTFLSIARTHSITAAAQELFISQSTATHRLKSLENELGTTLIYRKQGQRGIELTPKGEAFIPIADRWSALLSETQLWQDSPVVTDLNIGGLETINTYIIFPIIKSFIKNSPKTIRLKTRSKANRELYNLMENKELDIAFVTENYNLPNLPATMLYKEDYVVLYPRSKELDESGLIVPSQLNAENEIVLTWSKTFLAWHDENFHRTSTKQLIIDILPLAMEFLKVKSHWMTMPETIAYTLAKEFDMCIYRYKNPPPPRICYKITRGHLTPAKQELIQDLEESIDEYIRTHPVFNS